MKKLNKFAQVFAKILESIHWVGAVAMMILFVASAFAGTWLQDIFQTGVVFDSDAGLYGYNEFKTYGMEMICTNPDGTYNMTAIAIFSVGAMLILALMAMVFRNIYLMFKTAEGESKFSEGNTPFQKDIVRMIREIGIFLIASAAVSMLTTLIGSIVISSTYTVFDIQSAVFGIFMLCLSSWFNYGEKLEKDVDGLV